MGIIISENRNIGYLIGVVKRNHRWKSSME